VRLRRAGRAARGPLNADVKRQYVSDPQYFVWLALQALSGLLVMWPVTLVLLTCIAISTLQAARRSLLTRKTLLWSLVPGVIPIVILLWGVIFQNEGPSVLAVPISWEMGPIVLLFLFSIAIGVYVTWRAEHIRLLVASTSALFCLFALSAGFLSGMSVTGDWI
jgi:hypothetical protein